MSSVPIAEYALLADRHGAALVSRAGSVDWLCMPRYDASTTFARLLDDDAGHWLIAPSVADDDEVTVTRRYIDASLVLETTFTTARGTLVVTDALLVPDDGDPHALGRSVPHVLARSARCTAGEVLVDVTIAVRGEYGLSTPVLDQRGPELQMLGGSHEITLTSSAPPDRWHVEHGTAQQRLTLGEGESCAFALQVRASDTPCSDPPGPEGIDDAIAATVGAWNCWDGAHGAYDGPWPELVSVSARVLQGLTYAPTGATIAAPTTSLPEAIGHGRNWDYRYAWLRDASLTLQAMWVAACPDEAAEFFAWALRATSDDSCEAVQIVYGVAGERALFEHELDHLKGWRGSRPVRVGNGAWTQHQHDVYGELLDAAWLLREQAGPYEGHCARFLVALADRTASSWCEPDSGIWEIRGEERHYLSSKTLAWVALDRACRLHEAGALDGAGDRVARWRDEADAIVGMIREQGWNPRLGAYTQVLGADELDASALLLALFEVLPADDARLRSTVEAVEAGLGRGGLVDRYRIDDDLAGREGAFIACSFWLADAWARLGETDRAEAVFMRSASLANDVGLLAEEADPETGELLGNFPQVFSHAGLVNAAWSIQKARAARQPTAGATHG